MQLKHDIHNHTTLSRCCYDPEATAPAFIRRAAELGHTVFGISNHLWDEKVPGASSWYKNQMISYGLQLRDCVPTDTCGIRVMIGTETEYFAAQGHLGMLAETAKKFDYVLVPHSHTHMRGQVFDDNADAITVKNIFTERIAKVLPELTYEQVKKMANALGYGELDTIASSGIYFEPTVDMEKYCSKFLYESFNSLMSNSEFVKIAAVVPTAVAHPFTPCGFSKEVQKRMIDMIPDNELTNCFKNAKSLGVAIEVNTGALKFPDNNWENEPLLRVMKLALAAGCKFTFGTDAHSLKGLDAIRMADSFSTAVGITESDLPDFVK